MKMNNAVIKKKSFINVDDKNINFNILRSGRIKCDCGSVFTDKSYFKLKHIYLCSHSPLANC